MDGQVLVFGGYDADNDQAEGAAVYDPGAGMWRKVDGPPGNMGGATAAWADGQVLAVDVDGGLTSFDPGSGTWSERESSPFATTSNAVTATVWTGDRLLVVDSNVGGTEGSGTASYDPFIDEWARLFPPPIDMDLSDAVWTGTKLLMVADHGGSGSSFPRLVALEFDPSTDKWRELPAPPLDGVDRRTHGFAAWTGTELVVGRGQAMKEEGKAVRRRRQMSSEALFTLLTLRRSDFNER